MVSSMSDGDRVRILEVHVWLEDDGAIVASAAGEALELLETGRPEVDGGAITGMVQALVSSVVAWDTERTPQRAAGGTE